MSDPHLETLWQPRYAPANSLSDRSLGSAKDSRQICNVNYLGFLAHNVLRFFLLARPLLKLREPLFDMPCVLSDRIQGAAHILTYV